MTPIQALLLLPEHGGPKAVDMDVAAALNKVSAKLVRRHANLWTLTDGGRRFLAQLRRGPVIVVTRVVVRVVTENNTPLFHLHCDDDLLLRVRRTDLQRSLQRIRGANPGVRIEYDYRSSGHLS